ncbi:phosphatase PAP2-related protein [Bacteroidota bacterium]
MIIAIWKKALKNRKFAIELTITVLVFLIILFLLAYFLNLIENRNGIVLHDPVLNLFQPIDLTWQIFSVLYVCVFISIFYLLKQPQLMVLGIQAYISMIIFRICAMYLIPLDPPALMIPLVDPVVEIFGTGRTLTRDLFFSGHTATMFLLFLIVNNSRLKAILFTGTIIVGLSVILQHVHYSIDVLCAPVFAYAAYAVTIRKKGIYEQK